MIRNELLKAVMIGHAVGDALGVPVEFCSREELAADLVVDMRGYGSYPVPAGAWSDDTSMSLCALDSLARGYVDWAEIMQNFTKWACDGAYTPTGEMFDIGRTCLDAIHKHISDPMLAPTACGVDGEYANGNGSLMRIHPFVLYAWFKQMPQSEWAPMIEQASALTHAHKRSQLACKIYAYILMHLLAERNMGAVKTALKRAGEYYRDHVEYRHYERLFEADFERLEVNEIKSTGYVVDTLEAAVWCLLTTDNYRDCVLKAVNLGDDTDTVAAVAGGLAGVLYGYDSIPREWRETLIRREYIEEMCEIAENVWIQN